MASSSLAPPLSPVTSNNNGRHPGVNRALTAPTNMPVNGHFASVGQNGTANFEHGVQVIDEEKEFKYVRSIPSATVRLTDLVLI
jgi:hypothetical protein